MRNQASFKPKRDVTDFSKRHFAEKKVRERNLQKFLTKASSVPLYDEEEEEEERHTSELNQIKKILMFILFFIILIFIELILIIYRK